jgi:glycosyltransferase involved in cell wall biosynthesis
MARLALVHDYLLVMRGAERTLATMSDMWPEASVYTLLYDEAGTQGRFKARRVVTSNLQRLGATQSNFRFLLPVLAPAMQRLSLDGHDVVVSSSSAFAHLVKVPAGASHVCYCHTPFRYAWNESALPVNVPGALRPFLRWLMKRHRAADRQAAATIDQFVVNSRYTGARIQHLWGRDSIVVHPPVAVERFVLGEPQDYVLFVGELVSHKHADRAIAAAEAAGRRIKIVGDGPDLAHLRALASANVEFVGRASDAELAQLYAEAAALIVPNVEEFSIVAVEAQAAGRPVVAVDAGGVRETVRHGATGILVDSEDPAALGNALAADMTQFDQRFIRAHAMQFSHDAFAARMQEVVGAIAERDLPSYEPAARRDRRTAGARQ